MDRYLDPSFWSDDPPPMSDRESLQWAASFSPSAAAKLRQLQQAEAEARRDRESLEWAACFSASAEAELHRLRQAEAEAAAEARRDRERLEWTALFSERHEQELRALLEREAMKRESRERPIEEKYVEADHPRWPAGTPQGGQWATKDGGGAAGGSKPPSTIGAMIQRNRDFASQVGKPEPTAAALALGAKGEHSPTPDRKAALLRDFDKAHDLTLLGALKDGTLSMGDILRIKFTDEEIKQILKSAEKPGSDFDLTFFTAQNLPPRLRAAAERDFPDLPGDEKYAMQAFVSNQRRVRWILAARDPAFQQYVGEIYGLLRSLNPTHFMLEKGVVVATGKEPVLGGEASRLNALKDMLIYLAIMKGVKWGTSKIVSILAGPEAAADITVGFKGGGKLTIRRGAEYGPDTLESAVNRAAAGEEVTIEPPAPRPPRPSLSEVPRIKDDPRAFRRWFNELTPEEFKAVWSNPKLRKVVEEGLRWPGRQHEWLMVGRAAKFKEWGVTAEQIAQMRTPISKIRFKNPPGGHDGAGSRTTHNQIMEIIDSSPDFATFRTRLQKWANDRLEGGADALPLGLRP